MSGHEIIFYVIDFPYNDALAKNFNTTEASGLYGIISPEVVFDKVQIFILPRHENSGD